MGRRKGGGKWDWMCSIGQGKMENILRFSFSPHAMQNAKNEY